MIQDVSQKVYKSLAEKLATGEAISKQSVDSSEVPAPIRAYLTAVLEREAERVADSINNRRDVWIAESVEVRRARTAFAVAATRNVQIPADRVSEVLRRASDVVLRYLIRPSSTLQGTIFDRAEPSLDVEEILERMRMFSAYPYFHEVLRHYFAEKEIEHVERARLDAVLHRIDRQMTADFSADEWSEVLTPLYRTLGMVPEYADGVPVELLRMFFREKEMGEALIRLDGLRPDELVSPEQLTELLSAERESSEEAPASQSAGTINAEVTQRKRPATTHSPAQAEGASGDTLVPLWKQFQRAPDAPPPVRPERTNSPPAAETGVPIWQRFRQAPASGTTSSRKTERSEPVTPALRSATRPPATPPTSDPEDTSGVEPESSIDALERQVLGDRGARSRGMFVRQLFSGSESDYRSALESIARTSSWAEASRVIARDVFRRFDVNIYDEAAVGFTDMVEARFAEQRTR